jgi:hypothetical protein
MKLQRTYSIPQENVVSSSSGTLIRRTHMHQRRLVIILITLVILVEALVWWYLPDPHLVRTIAIDDRVLAVAFSVFIQPCDTAPSFCTPKGHPVFALCEGKNRVPLGVQI